MLRAAHDTNRSVVDTITIGREDLQFVHALEVPAERPQCAFDFKGKLTLVSLDRATNFQVSLCAVSKLCQRCSVVLVGHITQRTSASNAEVSTDSGCSERPLGE